MKPIIKNHKKNRARLNLSQAQYWGAIGISQTCGCRYEGGRNIPAPVRAMADLAYAPAHQAIERLAQLRGTSVEELLAHSLSQKGNA